MGALRNDDNQSPITQKGQKLYGLQVTRHSQISQLVAHDREEQVGIFFPDLGEVDMLKQGSR